MSGFVETIEEGKLEIKQGSPSVQASEKNARQENILPQKKALPNLGLPTENTSEKSDFENFVRKSAEWKGQSFQDSYEHIAKENPFLSEKELWELSQVEYDVQHCKNCVLADARTHVVLAKVRVVFCTRRRKTSSAGCSHWGRTWLSRG